MPVGLERHPPRHALAPGQQHHTAGGELLGGGTGSRPDRAADLRTGISADTRAGDRTGCPPPPLRRLLACGAGGGWRGLLLRLPGVRASGVGGARLPARQGAAGSGSPCHQRLGRLRPGAGHRPNPERPRLPEGGGDRTGSLRFPEPSPAPPQLAALGDLRDACGRLHPPRRLRRRRRSAGHLPGADRQTALPQGPRHHGDRTAAGVLLRPCRCPARSRQRVVLQPAELVHPPPRLRLWR